MAREAMQLRTEEGMHSRHILLLAGLMLVSCQPPAPLQLTRDDLGKHIDLRLGQEIELRLAANPTTGYRWQVVHAAPAVLDTLAGETFSPASAAPGVAGGGGTVTWRFRATRVGRDNLQLVYRRPWESGAIPAQTFVCEVAVNP